MQKNTRSRALKPESGLFLPFRISPNGGSLPGKYMIFLVYPKTPHLIHRVSLSRWIGTFNHSFPFSLPFAGQFVKESGLITVNHVL